MQRLAAIGICVLVLVTARSGGAATLAPGDVPDLAPYLRALAIGSVGQVHGLASGEPKRPSGRDVPYGDVSVLLLPFAPAVDAQLEQLKAHLRDSVSSYEDTYTEISTVREAYEHQLLAAGGGELIRGEVSDDEGRLTFSGVPEGEWLLIGWREDAHPVKPPRTGARDALHFTERPVSVGYAAVSYWRMRISVRAGEVTEVKLSDRSIWVTAVQEQLVERGATQKTPPKKRR